MAHEEIELFEAIGIHQSCDPFTGGQLAFFVLFGDAFFTATQHGFAFPGP
jgi:hypothetical protein